MKTPPDLEPEKRIGADSGRRILELDGLRAFAILPVIVHHFAPPGSGFWASLAEMGWVGVDLFFVLSGFLIIGILVRTKADTHYYRNFIVRRTLRIFPLYYVCLILFTMFAKQDAASWDFWHGPSWFFAYLGNFPMAVKDAFPPVFAFAPLWSLQVEEQFYLLFPMIVAAMSTRNLRRLLVGFVVGAPALRICCIAWGHPLAAYVLMPCRMDALAIGGLVALAGTRSLRFDRWCVFGAAILAVMFAFAANARETGTELNPLIASIGYTIIALTFAAVLMHILSAPSGRVSTALRWPPLIYIGQISYGLYLLHIPAFWVARQVFIKLFSIQIPGRSWAAVPVALAASLVGAGLSSKLFERPIIRLGLARI
jgi:peptidoglycan/LPS O-acetylase OafA/YrhL